MEDIGNSHGPSAAGPLIKGRMSPKMYSSVKD